MWVLPTEWPPPPPPSNGDDDDDQEGEDEDSSAADDLLKFAEKHEFEVSRSSLSHNIYTNVFDGLNHSAFLLH